ncbi:hypothetical protein Natoc_2921 [Natronococcus occultus SP4]|uniref:Uncharacterized protein n=1 Tax=Natronococcus occultus SP4 TaxID=694430 RepID=L0K051_9EURY|nr:hypothetical protein Natoc_2921 [Natronococcus occultus SP4]
MNVMQVLLVTTVLYFLIVAVWVLKIEDLIEQRSEERATAEGER